MTESGFDLATYYPIFAYLVLLILFVISIMVLTHTLGPWKQTPVKQMPYESGMDPIGDARQRFDVKFYLIAILFLVFDVELLFLYPWAVASRPRVEQLGSSGVASKAATGIDAAVAHHWVESRGLVFGEAMIFIGLLGLGFVYAWRKGVFRWR